MLFANPKSASLYIVQMISKVFGIKNYQVGFDKKSGDIYYPRLVALNLMNIDTVSHCHEPPKPEVLKMIESFNLIPIILYRNILDVIVSRRDMLLKDKWARELLSKDAFNRFINLDPQEQISITINLYGPQYFNFYTGWKDLSRNKELLFISYEELLENELNLFGKIGEYIKKEVNTESIQYHSEHIKELGGINFNKGVKNRWKDNFKNCHLKKIKELAYQFSCFDEEFLGINFNDLKKIQ